MKIRKQWIPLPLSKTNKNIFTSIMGKQIMKDLKQFIKIEPNLPFCLLGELCLLD
jgi:hypothetical protein